MNEDQDSKPASDFDRDFIAFSLGLGGDRTSATHLYVDRAGNLDTHVLHGRNAFDVVPGAYRSWTDAGSDDRRNRSLHAGHHDPCGIDDGWHCGQVR